MGSWPNTTRTGDTLQFAELGLSADLLRTVADEGYTEPTPIQERAIPIVLEGKDVLAAAQTGTGKTAAFTLPILDRLRKHANTSFSPARHPVRVLVLTPTRELAVQVADAVKTYGKRVPLRSSVVYGGVPLDPQIKELLAGVEILVATPGRLLDLVGQRAANLTQVEILVLDEADRMLDMGFMPDIRRILDLLPNRQQTLLFSATFSDEIRTLANSLLNDPAMVQVAVRNSTVEAVSQKVVLVDRGRKSELLAQLVKDNQWYQVLVFTRTKHGANRLAEYLNKHGVTALAIHGNKSQNARTSALAQFKSGELQALVATDIAARGLDIEQLPHVVNFDLPHVPEDYVHRIGRTGRAGATGEAISLVCADDKPLLADIEKVIRRQVPLEIVAGFEPNPNERAEPIQRGRGAPQRPAHRQAPKREGGEPRRTGGHTAAKKPARPATGDRAATPARAQQKTASRATPARPVEPARPRPVQGAPARSGESAVRTNIPGLNQPSHRRGR
jgi:ATP-dependent RNA helicase RhlE